MTATPRPTEAQRAALNSLAAGRAPTAHLRTVREVRDCESKTLPALLKHGWVDAGRKALAGAKP